MPDTGRVLRPARLLLPLALAAACTGNISATTPTNPIGAGPAVGQVFRAADRDPAPSLSGTTLDGDPLDTSAMLGKVVVVNFWASWCPPCRAEARDLNAVYAQTHASGVEFVGVDIKDVTSRAQAFQRTKQVPYPSLYDGDGTLLLRFRGQAPQQPPTTIVIDRQGRVAARFPGGVTETQLLGPVQVIAKEPA
jgi:thiol-disulfide isomerase/thioredoxin